MDELKLIVAGNLISLRQKSGMTQAELGERINYSDKSVSKWERGEAIPDAYVLTRLAAIYDTTVDALLRPVDSWQESQKKEKEEKKARERHFSVTFVILTALAGIWTMAVIMFVIFWLCLNAVEWIIFPCATLLSLITLLVLNSVFNKGRYNMWLVMLLVAAIVTLVYLFLLHFNPWQLFLILIPAEVLVFFSFRVRRGIHWKKR